MTLLYLVAAWAAGIFAGSRCSIAPGFWLALGGVCLALVYLDRHNRRHRVVLVCAVLLACGGARYAWAARPLPPHHVAQFVDTGYVTLTGVIARDPDIREQHVNLHVRTDSLTESRLAHDVEGLVLVQGPRYGAYAYGDRVTVRGRLVTPPEFDDFSYRDYLARRGVHALVPNAQVTVVAHDSGQPLYAALYALKSRAEGAIDSLLPSPQSALLSGILLGIESDIPPDIREAFNRTGVTHVIAISGANIVVVLRILVGAFRPAVGRRRAGWAALAGVGVYAALVGGDPAVVRAAIMGGMALLAMQLGRKAYGLTSLAFAIWLMTAWNPLVLWDVGFQLSVAATAGLVLFGDTFTAWLGRLLERGFAPATAQQITRWLAEPLTISLAAQIATLPLIVLYFGRLSLVALLANVLVVPAQAYIMTLGWLTVSVGVLWITLAEPLAWIVWIPLTYTLEIVRSLGRLEWASVETGLSPSVAFAYYAVLFGGALVMIQHPDDRAALFRRAQQYLTATAVLAVAGVVAVLVWAAALTLPDGRLHVHFLDVGHGTAVLIETPNGAQILVDGGPNPTQLRRAVGDALPFWDRTLDVLIVTQPRSAVIGALPALLDRYRAQVAITNGQAGDDESYQALARAWEADGTQVVAAVAGYRLETDDGVTLEVLHPQAVPDRTSDSREVALVLRVQYGNASFLLASDLAPAAEQSVLDAGWYVGSTVLLLPAHGSEKANPPGFLQAVGPQVAVASVGAGNWQGLPAPETVERLVPFTDGALYRTDRQGTVEIITDGVRLWIQTER